MGVRQQAAAAFAGGAHLILPDLMGCQYLGLYGVDEATTIRNLANPAAPGSIITGMTYGADYIETQSNAASGIKSLDTGIVPAGDYFIAGVIRKPTVTLELVVATGTNADALACKTGLFHTTTEGLRSRNSFSSVSGSADQAWPTASTTDYAFVMGWGASRGWAYVQGGLSNALTDAVSGARGITSVPRRPTSGTLQLNPDVGGNGTLRFASLAIFNRIPEEAERLAMYRMARAYFNGRANIVVV
jgi:hypothetical protein